LRTVEQPQAAEVVPQSGSRLRALRADLITIAGLIGITAIVVLYLYEYDMWLARVDLQQQLLPYYGFLGEQLRHFNIPGWNPHQIGGQPFAADPLSGWSQWPVMVLFTLFSPVVAVKILVAFNLLLGVLSAYLFARILGLNIPGSATAAVAFGLSSTFVQFNSYCCNVMGNYAPWIPVTLIGIELAARRRRRIERAAAVVLAGFGFSQLLASWLGQGTMYAVLIIGSYCLYRLVLEPVARERPWRSRFADLIAVGGGIALSGIGLAAAGLFPRLAMTGETNLDGGKYDVPGASDARGANPVLLLEDLLSSEFQARRIYLGTAIVVLALLAPLLARRRFAVPYFTVLAIIGIVLILKPTPLHELFFLIPRFEDLHTHSSYRIMGAILIGPAMLAAASVDRLVRGAIHWSWLTFVAVPPLVFFLARRYLEDHRRWLPQQVWVVLLVTLGLVGVIILLRRLLAQHPKFASTPLRSGGARAGLILPWIIIGLLVFDPIGEDMLVAVRGTSTDVYYNSLLAGRDESDKVTRVHTACEDPGGAGDFLAGQSEIPGAGPVRYFGFDPAGLRSGDSAEQAQSYQGRQWLPETQALLVGTRAICLGLYDVQGYSPLQLQRYVDYLRAINGEELNYHDAAILTGGITSPLLQLFNPGFVITPYVIPPERLDLQYVASTMTQVFENGIVRIFENPAAYPHAWFVHEARKMEKAAILGALDSGQVDPRQTALVEHTPPSMEAATGVNEPVTFTRYEPDEIGMTVTTGSAGLLVVSEVYAPGWNAYVDGERVPLYATNYLFRGIPVPAGTHDIELRYEPRSLTIGLWISVATVVVMIGVLLQFIRTSGWTRVPRRRDERSASASRAARDERAGAPPDKEDHRGD
jgi:hypothetical protein